MQQQRIQVHENSVGKLATSTGAHGMNYAYRGVAEGCGFLLSGNWKPIYRDVDCDGTRSGKRLQLFIAGGTEDWERINVGIAAGWPWADYAKIDNLSPEEIKMTFRKIAVISALAFILAGCAGMTRTEQNVLGGGALGAGLGAAIGAATGGSPAAGAAIGGAAGVVGGAIKDSWERSRGYPPPAYYGPPRY